jgi:CheY-like chemotaxis protein
VTTIRESQLLEGAISDPATLRDKVASREIFEGAQLTAADFAAAGDSLAAQLTDHERIVSVPLDSAHGLIEAIEAGNTVDVYAGMNVVWLGPDGKPINGGQTKPVLRLIVTNVPVVARRREEAQRLGHHEREPPGRRPYGGGDRLRIRQRQGVACPPAQCRREGIQARPRHRRDTAARHSADRCVQGTRWSLMNARGFNVYAALEGSFGLEAIQEALPTGTPVRAVALAEAGHAGNEVLEGADLVIVGCSQAQDEALVVISAATAQRPDRPVVVLYQGSPNGFLERAFEAGADDLIALPQSAGQLGFTLEKALARRRGGGACGDRRSDDHRPRGRRVAPARRSRRPTWRSHLRSRASRRCWSTSTCSSGTWASRSAWSRRRRSTTLAVSGGRSTRRRSTGSWRGIPRARWR